MKRARTMAMKVVGNKESKGSKGDSNCDKGGG
jgi:hypothetical protein